MPHTSRLAAETIRNIRAIAADASNARALAERVLAALEPALEFDDAEVLSIDSDSLLFTRLLAYYGDRLPHFAFFLRDVYLVSREPDWLSFSRLLTEGGGSAAFHDRFERWLRARPPAMSQSAFSRFWRQVQSPPGGGLRCGLRYRGRWVAVMQFARWEAGPGFTPTNLELLDRLAPTLGAAFASHLAGRAVVSGGAPVPDSGHLVFDGERRLAAIDEPGEAWLRRLPDDGLLAFGVDVPIGVQSVVNHLSAGAPAPVLSRVADLYELSVTIRGERARGLERTGSSAVSAEYLISIGRTPWALGHPAFAMLTARQRQIAAAVAEGMADEAVASRLGIGAATVHEQVARLHRLVGTTSRPALVAALNRP